MNESTDLMTLALRSIRKKLRRQVEIAKQHVARVQNTKGPGSRVDRYTVYGELCACEQCFQEAENIINEVLNEDVDTCNSCKEGADEKNAVTKGRATIYGTDEDGNIIQLTFEVNLFAPFAPVRNGCINMYRFDGITIDCDAYSDESGGYS